MISPALQEGKATMGGLDTRYFAGAIISYPSESQPAEPVVGRKGKHTAGPEQAAIGCCHLWCQAEMLSDDQRSAAESPQGVDDMRRSLHMSQHS